MIRKLLVFIEIAALVIVLRMPIVQDFLSSAQQTVTHWLITIEALPDKVALHDLREQSDGLYASMRPFQQDYFDSVTSSRQNVKHFHETYCLKDDKNPFISGDNRHQFCSYLSESPLLAKR